MNKIILVHYINSSRFDQNLLKELSNSIQEQLGGEVLAYVLETNNESKVECINPKLISEEEYSEVIRIMDRSQELMANFFENRLQN